MAEKTTVKVSHDTWRRLTDRKTPDTTYDDVIDELLDEVEQQEAAADA